MTFDEIKVIVNLRFSISGVILSEERTYQVPNYLQPIRVRIYLVGMFIDQSVCLIPLLDFLLLRLLHLFVFLLAVLSDAQLRNITLLENWVHS